MTTETHCHCGAAFKGSDHCPECFCEQYEGTCTHKAAHAETEDIRDIVAANFFWDVGEVAANQFSVRTQRGTFIVTVEAA